METPDWIIEHARLCLHSSLVPTGDKEGGSLSAQPQYTYNLTDLRFTHPNKAKDGDCGKRCRLLELGECTVREPFPESHDH